MGAAADGASQAGRGDGDGGQEIWLMGTPPWIVVGGAVGIAGGGQCGQGADGTGGHHGCPGGGGGAV